MWIKVDSYKDIPVGSWLVQCDEPSHGCLFHVANVRENVTVIGGVFGFDQRPVVAYRELPEPMVTDHRGQTDD